MAVCVILALEAIAALVAVLVFSAMFLAGLWFPETVDPETVAPVGAYYGEYECPTSSC